MPRKVLWVDGDANDFHRVHVFLRRNGIACEVAYSINEAYEILSNGCTPANTCMLLDAFVPLGPSRNGNAVPVASGVPSSDLTGHWLLEHLCAGDVAWQRRTVVLSAYTKEYLTARGFPKDLIYFHKEHLSNQRWPEFCKAVREIVASDA